MQQIQDNQAKIPFNFYKLPHNEHLELQKQTIVGVFDASGSMSSWWPFVAKTWNAFAQGKNDIHMITFDSKAYIAPNAVLNTSINNHGGGGTAILFAFKEFINQVKLNTYKNKNIALIFLSDGEDSAFKQFFPKFQETYQPFIQENQLNINFFTIGIGSGFPTFIAMELRNLFHNGYSEIPLCYVAPSFQENEMLQDFFLNIAQYIGAREKFVIPNGAFKFPWDKSTQSEFYSGSWVLSDIETKQLEIKNHQGQAQQLSSVDLDSISLIDLIEIAKEWLQNIQFLSLKENVQGYAKKAYDLIIQIVEPQILKLQNQQKNQSFALRIKQRNKQNYIDDYNKILKELKELYTSNFLNTLTQEEAAKRLTIGTQVGKYHAKALKFNACTIEDFKNARDEFIDLLQNNKIDFAQSSQEVSIYLLQNQKEIFGEPDLAQGLQLCPSQYDLVESLPVVGLGLHIRKNDEIQINAWSFYVHSIARHHKILDSLMILSKKGQVDLSIGGNQQEKINAVLPLFDKVDEDLMPLLRSKLFSILMTFQVMNNVDTCFTEAYAALMANTFLKLIEMEDSAWKQNIIDQIYYTFKAVYYVHDEFVLQMKSMQNDYRQCLISEHPNLKDQHCEDPIKAFLLLYCMVRDGDEKVCAQILEISECLIIEILARCMDRAQDLLNIFEIEGKQVNEQQLIDNCKETIIKDGNILNYYSFKELSFKSMKVLNEQIEQNVGIQIMNYEGTNIDIDLKKIPFKEAKDKYTIERMNNIYRFLNGKDITKKQWIIFNYHAFTYRNNYERNTTPILRDLNQIASKIGFQQFKKTMNIDVKKYDKEIKQLLYDEIKKTHQYFLPFALLEFQQKKKDYEYEFDDETNFPKYCCLSENCPYYLVPRKDYKLHRHSCKTQFPKIEFYKAIKTYRNMKAEDLYEKMVTKEIGKLKNHSIYCLKKDKGQWIDNIEQIRKKYIIIEDGQQYQ